MFYKNNKFCFAGDVVTNVVYELTKENSIEITFTAMTNKPTLVNMGSHCFFNLGKFLSSSFVLPRKYCPMFCTKCKNKKLGNMLIFFNLAGHQKAGKKGLWNHEFCFNAKYYTPFDEYYIPTGEIRSVESDPLFDFRTSRTLGSVLSKLPNEAMDASFCVTNQFAKNNDHSNMR